jgi:hypothetical protein
MPKVKVTNSKGLVQSPGKGIEYETTPTLTVQGKTEAFTISQGGLYTVTAGSAVNVTMPLASDVPGQMFIIRNGDANANVITGSSDWGDKKAPFYGNFRAAAVFSGKEGSTAVSIALEAASGSQVTMISDGNKYCVLAVSGAVAPTLSKQKFGRGAGGGV